MLAVSKASYLKREDKSGVGVTIVAPKDTWMAEPNATSSWAGPINWHLDFNSTYLSQEFAYMVEQHFSGTTDGYTDSGEDTLYLGACTVNMTASPTTSYEATMLTTSPWIAINASIYNTVTAQCGPSQGL
ncbi:MAG: hypothetical protein TREMPRED_004366 [Tremellales sp. Tagirdzhanova-0007]|nr:MAG: hypothetical protein TREMPRED_004366 [Tremellales sp. Tagirdzhanova-0007]